jgi:hypothetical protein
MTTIQRKQKVDRLLENTTIERLSRFLGLSRYEFKKYYEGTLHPLKQNGADLKLKER